MSARTSSPLLLSTKFHVPDVRGRLQRPELIESVMEARARLVLLRAPGGWGKSTTMAQWRAAESGRREFAWVTLEQRDNDPARFWTYMIGSLRQISAELGVRSLPMLQAPGVDLVGEMLPVLIEELSDLQAPVVLALDGYHLIDSDRVGVTVRALLEQLPATVTVAIAARKQLSLPVARLRDRGELLDLGVRELRFSARATRELCERILMIDLTEADVARLTERLEGWPAGLCLAAPIVAARDAAHREAFEAGLPNRGAPLADRLVAEMLSVHPPAVRDFLVRTSILRRMSSALCDAVVDPAFGAVTLDELAGSCQMIFELDADGEWYGRHALLQPALDEALMRLDPAEVSELHRRAADWHHACGQIGDAVYHATAGGELDRGRELIAAHWAATATTLTGVREVQDWIDGLPEAVVAQDLRLCVAGTYAALLLGDVEIAARWLSAAESAPLPAPFRDGFSSARGAIAGVRAAYHWRIGDVGAAMSAAQEMLAAESPESPWRAIGHAVLGLTAAAHAQWTAARMSMETYEQLGRMNGQRVAHVSGLAHVAAWSTEIEDWERARSAAMVCLQVAGESGLSEHWVCAGAHFARARLLERSSEMDEAKAQMRRALMLAARGAGPVTTAWLLTHLVRLLVTCHDPVGAQRCLEEAAAALATAPDAAAVSAMVSSAARAVAGAGGGEGGPQRAAEWLSERELEVLRLLATSLSRREIGAELFVTLNTVKAHIRSIFRKLGVSDRREAVARGRARRLI